MYKVPPNEQVEQRSKHLRRFATPYSLRETLGIVGRNFTGVNSKRNQAGLDCTSQNNVINEGIKPSIRVGFLGDIMNLDRKSLSISGAVREYFDSCDFLIGNFEATITNDKKRRGVWTGTPQPQSERIVDDLANIFPPEKFYLSLANNHSGDYARSVFERSCDRLRAKGFPLFGMKDTPFVDIHDGIRIVTGTMWSNQLAKDMLYLHDPDQAPMFTRDGAANMLYPHWGYELEAYPRQFIVDMANKFAPHYDGIIAHHGHNPQVVNFIGKTPVFYGLGDFCYYYDLPTYRYGLITRFDFGQNENGHYEISAMDWQMTINRHEEQNICVDLRADLPSWLEADMTG